MYSISEDETIVIVLSGTDLLDIFPTGLLLGSKIYVFGFRDKISFFIVETLNIIVHNGVLRKRKFAFRNFVHVESDRGRDVFLDIGLQRAPAFELLMFFIMRVDELMLQALIDRNSFGRVSVEHLSDEVHTFKMRKKSTFFGNFLLFFESIRKKS